MPTRTAPQGDTTLGPNSVIPCGPDSDARRRHLARTEHCTTCDIDGAIPETIWQQRVTPAITTRRGAAMISIEKVEGQP